MSNPLDPDGSLLLNQIATNRSLAVQNETQQRDAAASKITNAIADFSTSVGARNKQAKAEETIKELRDALADRDRILKNWIINQKAYKQLFNQFADEAGIPEEERRVMADKKIIEIGDSDEDQTLKTSGQYALSQERLKDNPTPDK